MKELLIDGHSLTIEDIYLVANDINIKVKIHPKAYEKINSSRKRVEEIVKIGLPVYGINTGFGALSNAHIKESDLSKLQLNLIRSHCTGVGESFSQEIVRAIILLRANCLASGHSGVTPAIIELLLDFLNHNITPIIPQKGSVGASGDLAPLSHMALCLIGEGDVIFENKLVRSEFAIAQINKKPIQLGPKDGLALINGTAVMAALGALATYKASILSKSADIISSLTLDVVRGTDKAFHSGISQLKPHKGQIDVSNNLQKILKDSPIRNSHHECNKVQDPYSLRCIPQVHGAIRQTINHAHSVISTEINSVTDNPLILESGEVISGGNFHGEAVALCMDYLAMGISELGNISERRVEKMMNPNFSDLPAFLTKNSGLNSGMMIAHVTSAALASENKYLCHPASVDSIPTSTDKEDHVSMGVTSGRKLHEVISNVTYCLAIELLCNTQAIEFLRPLKTTACLEEVIKRVRKHIEYKEEDRVLSKDMEVISTLISREEILKTVESIIGKMN